MDNYCEQELTSLCDSPSRSSRASEIASVKLKPLLDLSDIDYYNIAIKLERNQHGEPR